MGAVARGRISAIRFARRFLIASLSAWLAAAPADARDFRAADAQAPDHPTVQALIRMGELVAAETGGRHRIVVFPDRQLGEETDAIEQTRTGIVDLTRSNVALFANSVPEAGVLALPFLFRSADHLRAVLDGAIGDEILAAFEAYGLVGLTFYDVGARSIYTSARPVRTPKDLKGLRIRVQQSGQMMRMIELLGAKPVALPYGHVLTALSTGIVDGAENNLPSYVKMNHYRAARYYALTEHAMNPGILVMSPRSWESLSVEDRNVFRAAARESARLLRETWQDWEDRSRREALENGAIIIADVDRAAFAAAVAPLYETALANPATRRLVERIREAH